MEASFLSVNVPASWQELTDKQLYYVYRLLGKDIPTERVMMYAFCKFAKLHVIKELSSEVVLVRKGFRTVPLRKSDLVYGAMRLEFIGQPSTVPLRAEAYTGYRAVNPELRAFPFGHYLQVENYFQAFLQDGTNTDCLAALAALLYPGYKGTPDKTFQYNLLHWVYSLKQYFASEFPDLFQPMARNKDSENDWPDMKAITEAEIRALNGGDITKTQSILETDTWGALAELNAKAREAKELERIRTK